MNHLEGDPRAIISALEEHARSLYTILEPNSEDYEVARALLLHDPQLGLRGPDALHLAIVKQYGETLHTLDRRLLDCAVALRIPATDAGLLPPGALG